MKTLSDFKRALTMGSKWKCVHAQTGLLGIREVGKVQTKSVAFLTEKGTLSYLDFPKASEFEINSFGEAEIYYPENEQWGEPRRLVLTYSKVEG